MGGSEAGPLRSEKVKREKVESEAAGVSASVTQRFRQPFRRWWWRLVVSVTEDRPYHPEDEGFGVGSVFGSLNRRCLVGGNRLVVVSVALVSLMGVKNVRLINHVMYFVLCSLRVSERSFVHENVVVGVVGHHKVMAGECGLNEKAHNMGLLFGMLMKCSEDDFPKFEVHCEITPIQPNLYDCGIIVLQMMDLWDGQKKFDGNSMPIYTNEQLQLIRQQYIWRWILDVDNIYRQQVLQYYDALL
ncbi:hypothetical protein DEO72_LG6g1891 [Vigna unguiculata]|uniref:Ulp1 protease family n=1 Tax=Vigna unguiculata TaxID=3917 RepID=A0A4D6M9W2_VIGUN|nr:hypothetical protein DEO72_LG6g1891 [Vigna unguiculata]